MTRVALILIQPNQKLKFQVYLIYFEQNLCSSNTDLCFGLIAFLSFTDFIEER